VTHPVIPATDERPPPINHGFNYQQNVNPGMYDIEALLEGFRRRFCGLMTIDDQVAMDFQKVFSKTCDV
jgi:hypothetical protein